MPPRLLVGLPCYGGAVQVNCFQSMLKLLPALQARGIAADVKSLAQESLISRARNAIVAEFIGGAAYTHLLFIDADIGFEPDAVQRLIDADKPLVASAYPMKGYDWEKMLAAGREAADVAQLRRAGLQFAVNIHDEDHPADSKSVDVVNGFVRVGKASTGMMLIRREVFGALQVAYPSLKYVNDVAGYDTPAARGNFWAFFDTLVHPQSRRYLSEDYAFCHRWTQGCGGEVWLDLASRLSHYGQAVYEGSFLEAAGRGG